MNTEFRKRFNPTPFLPSFTFVYVPVTAWILVLSLELCGSILAAVFFVQWILYFKSIKRAFDMSCNE